MTHQKRGAQQVRIIGGKYRGRKLRFSGGASLRPTLGRTRETLFNWLRTDIVGSRCLDAFAGSGALGLEALSRGADEVVFVEQNPRTLRALDEAVRRFECADRTKLVKGDALTYLKHAEEPFDIVFLDPPYNHPQLLAKALQALLEKRLVRSRVYVEARSLSQLEQAAADAGCVLSKSTRSGDSYAGLITVHA